MTIWILAVVWLAIAVSSAYVQGAIRASFALLGIVAGLFLALPLSPLVAPLLPFVGITNPLVQAAIALVVAFFAVGVAFKVGGAFVHRKVEFLFKYRLTDAQRTLWERMNHRVGATLGTIGGCIYFMVTCWAITVLGYPTLQLGGTESESTVWRTFTRMSTDVVATRMSDVVGGFIDTNRPFWKSYYDTSDFLGFLVQNREVFNNRISTYPPFAALRAERYLEGDPARQNKPGPAGVLLDNKEFLRLWATERDPVVIWDHELTKMIITNAELKSWIQSLDTKDLQEYLSTGRSPKYSDEKILGRWSFDWPASLAQTRNENPDQFTSELMKYRKEVPERYETAELTATLDKVLTLRINPRLEGTRLPSLTNAPPRDSYTGQWRRTGGGYALDLHTRAGEKVNTTEAVVRQETLRKASRPGVPVERLYFKIENKTVCFDRIPE